MTANVIPAFDPDSTDATILAAYERVRAARVHCYTFDDVPETPEIVADLEARDLVMAEDEEQVRGNFATTAPGIMARLTLTIPSLDGNRWVDKTLMRHGVAALHRVRDNLDGHAQQVLWAAVELLHLEWETALADYRRSAIGFDLAVRVRSKAEEHLFERNREGTQPSAWLLALVERAEDLENHLSNEGQIRRLLRALPPNHDALKTKLTVLTEEGMDNIGPWIARDVAFLAGLTVNLENDDAA